ncbi:MAG: HD-GYP domain-containing protein [Betaproteobacteria bacterium]|nr:HD-GYP domain-containing protein [Betaproteobacteria bacterium]
MHSKVAVKDLKIGMFVADLDRPWIDTPFLIQGFLIVDRQQIAELQRICEFVVIDRARSTGAEFRKPEGARPESAATPPPPKSRLTSAITSSLEEAPTAKEDLKKVAPPELAEPPPPQPKRGLGGLMDSLRGLLKRPEKGMPDNPAELPPEAPRASLLPPSVPVTIYPDTRTVEEEVAPARAAYDRTSEVLRKLAADVWAGHPVEIARVEEVVDEMVESMVRNPDALMWVARLREQDITTYGHGLQVAVYLVAFGRHLGFPRAELSQLGTIGLLLDIGKIKLPKSILEKQGRLTPEEFEVAKSHVNLGLEILSATPNWPVEVLEGIAQHHERMNGSGYPRGLKAEQIGIFGRMAGIGDCFAALTKSRPYAEAVSSYEALRSITGWGGEYFHAPLTEQFVQAIGVFPVGSLVELSTGEVAVVVSHNKVRRLKPRVLLLTGPDKTPSAYPIMVDLLYDPLLGGEEPAFIRRSLPTGAYGLNPRENYLS